jgi:transposase
MSTDEKREEWSMDQKAPANVTLRQVRKRMRWHFSAEEKVRLILKGLVGDDSIAELCQKEGINQTLFYLWRKEFLDAGGAELIGNQWEFDKVEPSQLIKMKDQLREIVAKMAEKPKFYHY